MGLKALGYDEFVRSFVSEPMRVSQRNRFHLAMVFCVAAIAAASGFAGATSTSGRIGLMQIFDSYISSSQKMADGPRYDLVWGSWGPSPWYVNHPSLVASKYVIFMQDAGGQNFTSHPDWILYNCIPNGTSMPTPTHIPAYMQAGAYGKATPVDIHNPAVISDSVHRFASAAIGNGYNALAVDQVLFTNIMGGNAGAGSFGCGVWQGSTFVYRYTSKNDPRWALDVVNWVKTAKGIITTDPSIAPHRLKMVINHPLGSISDSREQQLLANTDMALNELGFTDYGTYTRLPTFFIRTLSYATYEQAHGVTAMFIDKFFQAGPLTPIQREWAIGTYLMANNGNALLYATYGGSGTGGYNTEHYYPEYGINMGMPCGAVSGGPQMYERSFANGLVVVNADTAIHSAILPVRHQYTDIEGRAVTNPLTVPPTDTFVLTTAPGTGCL